jgi:UDP:flavonoid glycosyltransferase YjiC (YdhE family)
MRRRRLLVAKRLLGDDSAQGVVMRVLFTCYPADGHLQPMVPLATAMRDRGHDVMFATAESFHPAVSEFGFSAAAAGADALANRAEFARRTPVTGKIPYAERREVAFPTLFAEIAAPIAVGEMLEFATGWQPDLVVHDVAEYAGALVAAIVGCPSVTHSFGQVLPASIAHAAARAIAPLWARYGVDSNEYGGLYDAAYLDICPPALQAPDATRVPTLVVPLRPEYLENGDVGFADWKLDNDWPSVYVTLGTINNGLAIFDAALTALGNERLNVLVTVGKNNDPAAFQEVTPNVCIRQYVPQATLLPTVDAVICHGGSGTMLGSLAFGHPLVVLPAAADQFYNGEACNSAGVGVVLNPDEVTPEAILSATSLIIHDPRYRSAAQTVKHEIAAMPTANDRVGLIEQLVAPP